tara:strand:+ start:173 stop:358 length:186 start_codon:yes stop_codon:yes gene_type:complete
MVYLNGSYDYEALAELAIDAYIHQYYYDLEAEGALTQTHVHEAKEDIIKALLALHPSFLVK